ncbi:MAG: histidinol-phosphate transaminase [Lachnospiraceae bacterium]|nr:histidinol-phosphate transaminase [Lachnospiraceae bacterium]
MGNWRDNLRKVRAYVPGEQPKVNDIVKLNTNENPYPPAPAVREMLAWFDTDQLRKYPAPEADKLVKALSDEYEVPENMIFTGVGSDDVLGMAFLTCFNSDKPVLFPDITYSFYDVWCELFGIKYETKKLDPSFFIVKEDYFCENGGIVIANPNAPTSIEMDPDDLEEIIAKNPDSVVIVDEAYVDFAEHTVLPLVNKYENLLVVRTFSKSRSLAGVRIGFAIGSPELISALKNVKNSYNSYTMNTLTVEAGVASLSDRAYFEETKNKILRTRRHMATRLRELGFYYPKSSANFLFVTHNRIPAKIIFQELRNRKIYVRYFEKPLIDNYLRITVGTEEELDKLIAALERIVSKYV